ncbi:MAG: hypothetical protein K2X62_13720 [Beijerinckiaceae bacterium]|jgi:acyl carrier protein|nr:hypothetical protein [Beijerinckiaceae bacterium]MDO9441154.1 hypothetical protein [Beijerinckiaceae bacterium]
MTREQVLGLINLVLKKNGRTETTDSETGLREAGFRSLDFSEVALRIEDSLDRELSFEASSMRRITTIKDVIDFFENATSAAADAG